MLIFSTAAFGLAFDLIYISACEKKTMPLNNPHNLLSMLLDNFNQMNTPNKMLMVREYAIQVGELQDKWYSYCLYQLFDFYVEVKFVKGTYVFNGICGFTAQSTHLDMYIKEINVASCIN
jgi:hypothetical protein